MVLSSLAIATVAALAAVAVRRDDVDPSTGDTQVADSGASPAVSPLDPAAPTTAPPAALPASTVPASTVPASTVPASTVEVPASSRLVEVSAAGQVDEFEVVIRLRIESHYEAMPDEEFRRIVLSILGDERGWSRAGVRFELDPVSDLQVILGEPQEVDALCLPLRTRSEVSCQNGEVVALNSERWMTGPAPASGWDSDLDVYRQYLVNHEVGHLFGLRHPTSQCPLTGGRAAVMSQQTGGLAGCMGNGFPLQWEIEWARRRPLTVGPLPSWDGPRPTNPGDHGDMDSGQ